MARQGRRLLSKQTDVVASIRGEHRGLQEDAVPVPEAAWLAAHQATAQAVLEGRFDGETTGAGSRLSMNLHRYLQCPSQEGEQQRTGIRNESTLRKSFSSHDPRRTDQCSLYSIRT